MFKLPWTLLNGSSWGVHMGDRSTHIHEYIRPPLSNCERHEKTPRGLLTSLILCTSPDASCGMIGLDGVTEKKKVGGLNHPLNPRWKICLLDPHVGNPLQIVILQDEKPKACRHSIPVMALTQCCEIGNSGVNCHWAHKYIFKSSPSLMPGDYLRSVFSWAFFIKPAHSVWLDTAAISSNTPMLPPLRLLLWFPSLPSYSFDI